MALTRSELIARFPRWPSNLAHRAVRTLIEKMAATLAAGGRIEIRDFGAFSVRCYPPTIKRNPKTGESVAVGRKPWFISHRGSSCVIG